MSDAFGLRVIIAGSRQYGHDELDKALAKCPWLENIAVVISGGCRGIDQCGEHYAATFGLEVERYPADWNKYGRAAGPIRNALMAHNADCLLAVWDGKSKGTKNMIDEAKKAELRVFVFYPETGMATGDES